MFTPIATMEKENDTYRYKNNGNSHVAYYMRHSDDNKGIFVLDQNHDGTGSTPKGGIFIRFIPFSSTSKNLQAKAGNYHLIEKWFFF